MKLDAARQSRHLLLQPDYLLWRRAASLVVFAGLPLLAAFLTGLAGLDLPTLFRDPASATNQPPYLGLYSNLGVLGWWAGAVSALLAASVLPRSRARRILAFAGVLTGVLAVDDLFMLHEEVMPSLGLPEELLLGAYALAGIVYLVLFRDFHLYMNWPLLLASLALLGTSVVVDLSPQSSWTMALLEDGTKFAGILSWAAYHVLTARYCLRQVSDPYRQ